MKINKLLPLCLIQIRQIHGETFYINFYYGIFQFREKRITLRIFLVKILKFIIMI